MGGPKVQIPIDDFVTGDLPAICVATGVESSTVVEFENDRSVVRGWWLFFLFLGPLGLLAMLGLYALSPRPTPVRGLLPMTREAYDRRNSAACRIRRAYVLGALATGGVIVALAVSVRTFGDPGSLVLVILVVLLFAWLIALPLLELANRRRNRSASRRWPGVGGWRFGVPIRGLFTRWNGRTDGAGEPGRKPTASDHGTGRACLGESGVA